MGTASNRAGVIADTLERVYGNDDARFGISIGLLVLGVGAFVTVLFPAPAPILVQGVISGALSALVAMGLVLIYRANGIINFAQGDLGGLAAVLAASLIVGKHWPFFAAVGVGLLAALLLGALTEIGIVRRFAKSPRLILTVVTIGLQQLFAAGQLALPSLFNFKLVPQPPVPFNFTFDWFPATFNAGHIMIVVIVPIVVVGMGAFFRFSDIGIAVRAQAESADRAALLGIPVKRIGTLVWVLAAGLSGLGVLLRLPIQGVAIGDVLGPNLMLRALAAAVIARMESLPLAFGAAIVLGTIVQAGVFATQSTIVPDALLFFIILGGLLLQRRHRLSRAEDAGVSSWTAVREVRPIPNELAGLPVIRWTTRSLTAGLLLFLLYIPLRMSDGTVSLFGVGLIFAMILLSLVILTGWAGQISLGHLAFAAFGAAVAGTLAQQGKNFFVTLLVAGLVGMGIAVALGIPALRIRGLFFAVTTLAFAVTTGEYFLNATYFPWLVPKAAIRVVRPVLFNKFDLESERTFYYFIFAMTVLVLGSVWSLRHSRTGRALVATRDNTRAAPSYGVGPTGARLTAFALAGFIAAFAGGIFFYHQHDLSDNLQQFPPNLQIFSVAVIGGLGSLPGALIGAAYQTFVQFSPLTAKPETQLFATGVGVLFILLVLPAGFGGLLYSVRDSWLRWIARRRDIIVPSLLADVRVEEASDVTRALKTTRRAPPPDAILRAEGIDIAYGKAQVVFGADFHVGRGEIVALLGTNGAGKSTLLSAIAGLITPVAGTITYEGRDITKSSPNETVAAGIVLMPGARGVFPTLTVEENLRLATWLFRKDRDYVKQVTDQVLGYFPILKERWTQRAGNLSGGEQQMLTLGQVFIAKPKVLMIDELSLGLAPVIVERLLDIVRAIHENGTSIVLVEQSVNIAVTLAERAVFLEKGEVRFEGPTSELLNRPDLLRAVFLSDKARRSATLAAVEKQPFEARCETCGREHGIALATSGLSVSFGGIHAVEDVDLDVREHQIIGIIGPNGAGKTTVFDLISGFVEPSSGSVTLNGTDVSDRPPHIRAMLGLGRSFQDARLFPAMTVRQAISTALERHVQVRDPIAAFLMSPAVRISERHVAAEVARLVELLNLEAFADKFVGELSTGTRRIVDLACTLAHDPSVLLLDEPSSGLAQRETEALAPVLLDIREQTRAAVIVIEHDIPLVMAISDELIALELGRVVVRGDPDDVIHHPSVVEGYLGSTEAVIQRSGRRAAAGRRSARRKKISTKRRSRPAAGSGSKGSRR